MNGKFSGFSPEAPEYLFNLSVNNNKTWFEEHRSEYERYLLEPFRMLVEKLAETMLAIDGQLEVRPAIGKTLSRMHRDTRFSKDKTPYKSAMWLSFSRKDKRYDCLPGFFFEITPFIYRYGMGSYCAPKAYMDSYRKLLLRDNRSFFKAIEPFTAGKHNLKILGISYKKVLDPELPDKLQPWYQRRELYLMAEGALDKKALGEDIAVKLAKDFTAAAPLYHFLLQAAIL